MTVRQLTIDPVAQDELDQIIPFDHGQQQPVPSSCLEGRGAEDLAVFCKRHGLYQIITTELVSFCRKIVGGRRAIEIGTGRGSLGAALNIPQTDSHLVQSRADVRRWYEAIGERTDPLAKSVEKLDASQAMRKYEPKVVVACWVTELGDTEGSSSPYGVDEQALVDAVDTYLLIGNAHVHGTKRILSRPHQRVHLGSRWLMSRATHPEKNAIWIWNRQGG